MYKRQGQPPLPETAQFAANLRDALISCYGQYINAATFTDQGECLKNKGIPDAAISEIKQSIAGNSALQCVGFARAVAAGVGHSLTDFQGDAKDYAHDGAGYQWYSAAQIKNIQPGDLFIITQGRWGHIAVVVAPLGGNGFLAAEAWGMDVNGQPQGHVRTKEYGFEFLKRTYGCLLYTSPSPRD